MNRLVAVGLIIGLLLMAAFCRPAAKPAPSSARADTAATAVNSGDICPPDSAEPLVPDSSTNPGQAVSPETTRAAAAPVPKRESVAAKNESPPAPPKLTALPRMWDFGADNCLPCKMMEPILAELEKEYAGRVDVRIINVYKDRPLAGQYRIQIIPTQIFMDPTGKELFRHVGFYPRDSILAKFREHGFIPRS